MADTPLEKKGEGEKKPLLDDIFEMTEEAKQISHIVSVDIFKPRGKKADEENRKEEGS